MKGLETIAAGLPPGRFPDSVVPVPRTVSYRFVAFLVCLVFLAPMTWAADWSFDPIFTFAAERTDDVFASSGAVAGSGESDVALTLDARLAMTANNPRSEVSFVYQPMHEAYQDFGDLDNTSHRVHLGWNFRPTRRNEWETNATWSRQERQRVSMDDPTLDQVALPRTRFETYSATAQWRAGLAPRSRLVLYGAVDGNRYDAGQVDGLRLADVTTTSAQVGYEFDANSLTVVGVSLFGSRIDEGFRGERDVLRLLGVYQRVTDERTIAITLGAAKTSVRDPGEDVPEGFQPDEPTEVVGSLTYQASLLRRGQLQMGLFRDVASSGGTGGTTISTGGFVSLRVPAGRWSHFSAYGHYAKRDPLSGQILAGESETMSYRVEWNGAFSSRWYLVVAGERFDQSSDEASLDRAYTIWSLGLRWSPTAPRR